VGRGIVSVQEVGYSKRDGAWSLRAKYALNRELAEPVLIVMESLPIRSAELHFVREVIYAISGFGLDGLVSASILDATYGDPLVDVGGMIEVEPDSELNASAVVAFRFGSLLPLDANLSPAEMINLYARQLYSGVRVA